MADIYIPGVKSRFNSEKLIEDLMKVEKAPRDRAEKNVERLEQEKTWWLEVGNRLRSLRDSARILYSFQNPFSERIVSSTDDGAVTGTAMRSAVEQERRFTVTQTAQADRFLSGTLEENFKVEAGTYSFSVGQEKISFNFRGGTLQEFAETLNRRSRDLLQASLITVRPGTKSLLLESKVTGEENPLGFLDDAETLGVNTGMIGRVNDSRRDIGDKTVTAQAESKASIPVNPGVAYAPGLVLQLETATEIQDPGEYIPPQPPPGPDIPAAGAISYGGIILENEPSTAPIPPWNPPPPPTVVDDLQTLYLTFQDGSSAALPPIGDSEEFETHRYPLAQVAQGKTIVSIDIDNRNTHREVSVRNIQVFDPAILGGVKPLNPVSRAQDAIVAMEGVEVRRPGNDISDLIPGVTVNVLGPTDRPVRLRVEPDRKAVKDAIIDLVGNYNRMMAEINVLTRRDEQVIEELTYLSKEEQDELKKRLGVFLGDSTLTQIRSSMQRITGASYPTSAEQDLALLAQIGIGTDVRRGGASAGFDPARLRGYLEIDEKVLDSALKTKLPAIAELFGMDTNGDLIADEGVAVHLENLSKPYVESGGIIALKTGNVNNRIDQEKRRIDTIDRQLAGKEAELQRQYGQMEGAYNRMEQLSSSLDRFSEQNSANNKR